MLKRIPFLILFFFFVLSRQGLWAREDKIIYEKGQRSKQAAVISHKKPFVDDGISFHVKQPSIVFTSASGFVTGEADKVTPVFAVRYKVVNNNQTRKLTVAEPIHFALKDEFGNMYAQLPAPSEYSNPVQVHEANFPSLYPGESVEEVVFFEAPIAGSRTLFLTVDAQSVGIRKEFIVKVPTKIIEGIERIAVHQDLDELQEPSVPPVIGPIKIVSPQNGAVVRPGEKVHVRVEVGKDSQSPSSVYVTVPGFVLEDRRLELQYDLKVPESAVRSMAITVIGKWELQSGEQVLSDSVVLKIAEETANE